MDAMGKGLHQFSTWNDIKILLEIDDPQEYFYSIVDCGDVTTKFQFTIDFMANKFTCVDPQITAQVHDTNSNVQNYGGEQIYYVDLPVVSTN
jgi:hypothetical protein